MSLEFRHGNNTDITVVDGLVHKVTRYAFAPDAASRLAGQLEDYAAAFSDEPISVPTLEAVNVIPDETTNGHHIEHVIGLCEGPNLCTLDGDELKQATSQVLGQVASMLTIDHNGTLRLPFDAAAQNFHLQPQGGVLVDIFPPLLRHKDGSFPLENIQYSYPWTRQRIIPYTRGTIQGAMLQILFTAALGDRPQHQAVQAAKGGIDWCYDVIPDNVSGQTKDLLRRQIGRRFIPHFIRSTVSDGVCMARKVIGIAPYRDIDLDC